MLRTVHLYGSLKKRYGASFELDVSSAQEAAQALGYMVPGFRDDIASGMFRVIAGSKRTGYALGNEEVRMTLGKTKDIHIVPVVRGAKNNGLLKIVAGIALIGLAFVPGVNAALGAAFGATAGGTTAIFGATANSLLFKAGAMLLLGGAYQAIVGTPTMDYEKTADEKQDSFIFNGPVNTSVQGGVVPVVFGRMMVGSVVASGGITPENIEVGS